MSVACAERQTAAMETGQGLHVVHVVLSLECGGLEHVVLDLAREGQRSGQWVTVICLERPGVLAAKVEELGIRVHCMEKPAGLAFGLLRRRLRPLLRELRPDVVHTHQIGALLYAGAAARAAGMPVVVHTEHGKHYGRRLQSRWLGRIAGRYAERFFCVSTDIAAEVIGRRIVPARKVVVVPNGIDTERFGRPRDAASVRRSLGIPPEAPVIGTVGRLSEIKRQDLLIRAFATLRRDVREAHLLLVGDGELRGDLERLAAELGVGACVHFAGYQAERERYLQAMDVFALTSRSEGMPLVVLEAWAAGVPVVASRVGGLPELVEEGRTGVLFDSGDETELAEQLRRLIVEPTLSARLRDAGRSLVRKRFDTGVMAENYAGRYRALLAGVAS